jgi:hypothetical protein
MKVLTQILILIKTIVGKQLKLDYKLNILNYNKLIVMNSHFFKRTFQQGSKRNFFTANAQA